MTEHATAVHRDSIHDAVAERLGVAGQQYTANRRAVVDALRDAGGPITLPDVLAADRSLAQSSAYRCLSVLADAGVVTRLAHVGEHAYFELAEGLVEHHHHLICERCGGVSDVVLPDAIEGVIDRSFTDVARNAGFTPGRHSVDIYGTCGDCS